MLIAVVDDDTSVRTALDSLLRSMGVGVSLFASAEDFLATVLATGTASPDGLICDIDMPGMSGWDLWDTLQQSGRAVPTILISAFAHPLTARPLPEGVRFFRKPFDAGSLVAAVLEQVKTKH
jgi:FixJ family two-component response regulator